MYLLRLELGKALDIVMYIIDVLTARELMECPANHLTPTLFVDQAYREFKGTEHVVKQ